MEQYLHFRNELVLIHVTTENNCIGILNSGYIYDQKQRGIGVGVGVGIEICEGNINRTYCNSTDLIKSSLYIEAYGVYFRLIEKSKIYKKEFHKILIFDLNILNIFDKWHISLSENNGFYIYKSHKNNEFYNHEFSGDFTDNKFITCVKHCTYDASNILEISHSDIEFVINNGEVVIYDSINIKHLINII